MKILMNEGVHAPYRCQLHLCAHTATNLILTICNTVVDLTLVSCFLSQDGHCGLLSGPFLLATCFLVHFLIFLFLVLFRRLSRKPVSLWAHVCISYRTHLLYCKGFHFPMLTLTRRCSICGKVSTPSTLLVNMIQTLFTCNSYIFWFSEFNG